MKRSSIWSEFEGYLGNINLFVVLLYFYKKSLNGMKIHFTFKIENDLTGILFPFPLIIISIFFCFLQWVRIRF